MLVDVKGVVVEDEFFHSSESPRILGLGERRARYKYNSGIRY